MTNHRPHARPALGALALLLPLVACGGSGLAESYQLDRLRLLAVAAEPAEPRPGDTVTFSRLVYLPEGQGLGGLVWFACLPSAADSFGCQLDPTVLDAFTSGEPLSPEEQQAALEAAMAAGLIGFEPVFQPTWLAPANALDGLDEIAAKEGVSAIVNLTLLSDDPDEEPEIAYKRVPISLADTPNHNPVIEGLDVYKVNGSGDPTGDPIPWGGPDVVMALEAGETYEITPTVPEASIETYTFQSSEGVEETRTEEPYFTWYTEGGSFDQPFSLYPATEVQLTVPEEDFTGVMAVVMRDRRGGMAWQVLRFTNVE